MNKGNPASFNQVAQGAFAPRSAGAISANLTNPNAMACVGGRMSQKHMTAGSSGGLAAAPRNAR